MTALRAREDIGVIAWKKGEFGRTNDENSRGNNEIGSFERSRR